MYPRTRVGLGVMGLINDAVGTGSVSLTPGICVEVNIEEGVRLGDGVQVSGSPLGAGLIRGAVN
jgi:hypothetical protein